MPLQNSMIGGAKKAWSNIIIVIKKEGNNNKLVTITLRNNNKNDVLLDVRREIEKEKEMQIQESLIKMVFFERILCFLFALM
jgi:uncharacterized protein YrzB (UPF0473 family)